MAGHLCLHYLLFFYLSVTQFIFSCEQPSFIENQNTFLEFFPGERLEKVTLSYPYYHYDGIRQIIFNFFIRR